MTDLRDLLCDTCLYKLETDPKGYLEDLCDRCWEKMLKWLLFDSKEHERLLDKWKETLG